MAVTAQAIPDDRERIARAGFDGVLAQPLTLASFDAMLDRLMPTGPGAPA